MTPELIAMGLSSTVVSILANIAINEVFSQRRRRREALVLLQADLIMTADLLQMWLERPGGSDWNGIGPRVRALSSLAVLGTAMSHLPTSLLLHAQKLELLLLEAQKLCAARQEEYSSLRSKGVERDHPRRSTIEAYWETRVIGCLRIARDLQAETDTALARVGRTALFTPV